MPDETPEEREQAELAAAEAAGIGADPDQAAVAPVDTELDGPVDPALRPVYEAGGGEAEGFEQAEELLIEHASHGDEQSAHAILHHQGIEEEDAPGLAVDGEADRERSTEREDDDTS